MSCALANIGTAWPMGYALTNTVAEWPMLCSLMQWFGWPMRHARQTVIGHQWAVFTHTHTDWMTNELCLDKDVMACIINYAWTKTWTECLINQALTKDCLAIIEVWQKTQPTNQPAGTKLGLKVKLQSERQIVWTRRLHSLPNGIRNIWHSVEHNELAPYNGIQWNTNHIKIHDITNHMFTTQNELQKKPMVKRSRSCKRSQGECNSRNCRSYMQKQKVDDTSE